MRRVPPLPVHNRFSCLDVDNETVRVTSADCGNHTVYGEGGPEVSIYERH